MPACKCTAGCARVHSWLQTQLKVPPSTSLRLRFVGKPHAGTGAITFTADDGETFAVPLDDPAQVLPPGAVGEQRAVSQPPVLDPSRPLRKLRALPRAQFCQIGSF